VIFAGAPFLAGGLLMLLSSLLSFRTLKKTMAPAPASGGQ
jgi:hypothetical protein